MVIFEFVAHCGSLKASLINRVLLASPDQWVCQIFLLVLMLSQLFQLKLLNINKCFQSVVPITFSDGRDNQQQLSNRSNTFTTLKLFLTHETDEIILLYVRTPSWCMLTFDRCCHCRWFAVVLHVSIMFSSWNWIEAEKVNKVKMKIRICYLISLLFTPHCVSLELCQLLPSFYTFKSFNHFPLSLLLTKIQSNCIFFRTLSNNEFRILTKFPKPFWKIWRWHN
jgi:hypothetical protein